PAALGVEQKPRSLDGIAGNDDVLRRLVPPLAVAMIGEAGRLAILAHVDPADHRQVADLGAGLQRARDEGDEHALLGIRRAAVGAKAAIDAWVRHSARCRQGGEWDRRPFDADRLASAREHQAGRVHRVRAVRVALAALAPRVAY